MRVAFQLFILMLAFELLLFACENSNGLKQYIQDATAEYTVTFISNGDIYAIYKLRGINRAVPEPPPPPLPEGAAAFLGWYKGWYTGARAKWDFSADVAAGDLTLYARWSFPNSNVTIAGQH